MKTVEQRFFEKVDKDTPNGCWNWIGGCVRGGYGNFWDGNKMVGAHRFSYELFEGPISEGKFVCHTCDNPRCVNPDHLWLGTAKENTRDAMRKGRLACGDNNGAIIHRERMPRGSNHGRAKLTEKIVIQARIENSRGVLIADLARKYGVTGDVMRKAIYHITWKMVENGE